MALIREHSRHPFAQGRRIKISIKGKQNKINNKMTNAQLLPFKLWFGLECDLVLTKQNI